MENAPEKDEGVQNWLDIELRRAKSTQSVVQWGRQVIRAIDFDDHLALAQCMTHPTVIGPASLVDRLQTSANHYGYAEYLWTPRIHEFLGDTALHLSLRQKKTKCVYMLLSLGANVDLPNAKRETCAELCLSVYHTTHENMLYDSKRVLFNETDSKRWKDLPESFRAKDIEDEAWRLMRAGRLLYSEVPRALQPMTAMDPLRVSDNTRKRLSFNLTRDRENLAREIAAQDLKLNLFDTDNAGTAVNGDAVQGEKLDVQAMYKKMQEQAKKWKKIDKEGGGFHFLNEETGEISQDPPAGWRDEANTQIAFSASENNGSSFESLTRHMNNSSAPKREKSSSPERRAPQRDFLPKNRNTEDNTLSAKYRASMWRKSRPALPIDDVWTKGTCEDIAQLIERQKTSFLRRRQPAEQHIAKGLSLLDAPHNHRAAFPTVTAQDKHMSRLRALDEKERALKLGLRQGLTAQANALAHSLVPQRAQRGLGLLQKTLKLDGNSPQNIAQNLESPHWFQSGSIHSAVRMTDPLLFASKGKGVSGKERDAAERERLFQKTFKVLSHEEDLQMMSRALAAQQERQKQTIAGQGQERDNDNAATRSKHQLNTDSARVGRDLRREIRVVSTASNLKYLAIGDTGAAQLAAALRDDPLIHTLSLARARVGDVGATALAVSLSTMRALRRLDLSQNAIGDDGAVALSAALSQCERLQSLSLTGNRLSLVGVLSVIEAIWDSLSLVRSNPKRRRALRERVFFLSLRNNRRISERERESVRKALEDKGFVCEERQYFGRRSELVNKELRERHRFVLRRDVFRRDFHRTELVAGREVVEEDSVVRSTMVDWARNEEKQRDAERFVGEADSWTAGGEFDFEASVVDEESLEEERERETQRALHSVSRRARGAARSDQVSFLDSQALEQSVDGSSVTKVSLKESESESDERQSLDPTGSEREWVDGEQDERSEGEAPAARNNVLCVVII